MLLNELAIPNLVWIVFITFVLRLITADAVFPRQRAGQFHGFAYGPVNDTNHPHVLSDFARVA